jgi:hypothetical protein
VIDHQTSIPNNILTNVLRYCGNRQTQRGKPDCADPPRHGEAVPVTVGLERSGPKGAVSGYKMITATKTKGFPRFGKPL